MSRKDKTEIAQLAELYPGPCSPSKKVFSLLLGIDLENVNIVIK